MNRFDFSKIINDEDCDIESDLNNSLRLFEETLHDVSNIKNIIQCSDVHRQSFEKYIDMYCDKEIVLCGSGPTAKKHKYKENAIYIGVNNACLLSNVIFDYLFCQDFYMNDEFQKSIISYRRGRCKKFFGVIPDNRMEACRKTDVAKHVRRGYAYYYDMPDVEKYYINDLYKNNFALDIMNEPLLADGVIFCALLFALITHPKNIYLVGCDCTSGFFYESNMSFDTSYMIKMWEEAKDYICYHYPDIKVYSINPVGLKGMFNDIYE